VAAAWCAAAAERETMKEFFFFCVGAIAASLPWAIGTVELAPSKAVGYKDTTVEVPRKHFVGMLAKLDEMPGWKTSVKAMRGQLDKWPKLDPIAADKRSYEKMIAAIYEDIANRREAKDLDWMFENEAWRIP
jgi:hypothetical protein